MSETNAEPQTDGAAAQEPPKPVRAPSPTPSEKSIKSDISTASSRLPKPSGMRPPSSTATIRKPSTSSITATSTPVSTRIGRLCTAHGHGAKAGPPPLELHKSEYHFSISFFFVFISDRWKKCALVFDLLPTGKNTIDGNLFEKLFVISFCSN